MAADRPRSWMVEVGATTPRRPSIPGPLLPFDISTTPKTMRSQSYTHGQRREVLAWQQGVADAGPGLGRPAVALGVAIGTNHDFQRAPGARLMSPPSTYRPTFFSEQHSDEDSLDFVGGSISFPHVELESNWPRPQASPPTDIEYCVVEFKVFRADVYQYSTSVLDIKNGDMVIVDADRGFDLGAVDFTTPNLRLAEEYRSRMMEKHKKALIMYSSRHANFAADRLLERPNMANGIPKSGLDYNDTDPSTSWTHEPDGDSTSWGKAPRMVKRKASEAEVFQLRDKEGMEAKAKRLCQQKARDHRLDMEVVDAEFQHDHNKLTFYFVANGYIVFNSLVQDLFRQFKTRIWMSQVHTPSDSPKPAVPARELATGFSSPPGRQQILHSGSIPLQPIGPPTHEPISPSWNLSRHVWSDSQFAMPTSTKIYDPFQRRL